MGTPFFPFPRHTASGPGPLPWAARVLAWCALGLLCGGLLACSPRELLVREVGNALASQGQQAEEDLALARDASPFYLKLSESLLAQSPGHLPLAEAVAGGFTQYAYAFVAFEAERLAPRDASAAHALNERARRLYRRAHRHAMAALEQVSPGFAARLMAPAGATPGPSLEPQWVGLAYWAAASWAGAIALSKDDPDAVADLPAAVRLAGLAHAVSPGHGQGALASLMGTLEAARPGGSPTQAARYFDEAVAAGLGLNAGVYVARAEALALPAGDRQAFGQLLGQALAAAARRRDLSNDVMRERATWLLGSADDFF